MEQTTAPATGVQRLVAPRSIAMVGASNNAGRIGGQVYATLARAFTGPLYPVHPRDETVLGHRAYRSVLDLPEPVDLVVVAVPAEGVPAVIAQCGEHGAGGVVLLTAGFAEAGPDGAALQERVAAAARAGGV